MPKNDKDPLTDRITISFTAQEFRAISVLAKNNAVSKAWLVRHAAKQFLQANKDRQLKLKFETSE